MFLLIYMDDAFEYKKNFFKCNLNSLLNTNINKIFLPNAKITIFYLWKPLNTPTEV
jgi:hypothetical protein